MRDIAHFAPRCPPQWLFPEASKQATFERRDQVEIRPADERTKAHLPSFHHRPEQNPADGGDGNNQPQKDAANKQQNESSHVGQARLAWRRHQPILTAGSLTIKVRRHHAATQLRDGPRQFRSEISGLRLP